MQKLYDEWLSVFIVHIVILHYFKIFQVLWFLRLYNIMQSFLPKQIYDVSEILEWRQSLFSAKAIEINRFEINSIEMIRFTKCVCSMLWSSQLRRIYFRQPEISFHNYLPSSIPRWVARKLTAEENRTK